MFYKKPPVIVHWHKPEGGYMEMARDACKNVRLSKRATNLFLYYASCKSGFRPSEKVICDNAGLDGNIRYLRIELVSRGLIGYGANFENMLVIDWNRVRSFAMLEQPLQYVKGKASDYFRPMQSPKEKKRNVYRKKKTIGELCWKDFIEPITWLSEDEIRWIEFLKSLTEDQYCELTELFRQAMGNEANFVVCTASQDYYINPAEQYDESWMHTPEYIEKMRQDAMFLKNQPQELPF